MAGKQTLSRRRVLQAAAGVGGGVAAASFAQLFGLRAAHAQLQDAQDTPQTILNLAATAEALAITCYYQTVAGNPLGLSDGALGHLTLTLTAEQAHLSYLQSLGGEALATGFYVPELFLSDQVVNATTCAAAEVAFAGAYLAATRRFAELGEPRLAATMAQHAASEVEHLTLVRLIGGLAPANPNSLPAPIYFNVSDVVPTLVPFIQGGDGFVGPIGLPGAAAVKALAGSLTAAPIPTFTQVF